MFLQLEIYNLNWAAAGWIALVPPKNNCWNWVAQALDYKKNSMWNILRSQSVCHMIIYKEKNDILVSVPRMYRRFTDKKMSISVGKHAGMSK